MKLSLAVLGIMLTMPQQDNMTVPKVERHNETHTETTEIVTRTCPKGYEGHLVDPKSGFTWEDGYWNGGGSPNGAYVNGINIGGELGYTVCFKKEFMDGLRKNPDLLVVKPEPPLVSNNTVRP